MNLKGKNVLVTGIASNRSISFAIAKLNDNNVNVIISYQNERLKDRVKKLLDESKIPFKAYQCDLSIDQEITELKNSIVNDHEIRRNYTFRSLRAQGAVDGKYLDNITREDSPLLMTSVHIVLPL